MYPYERLIPTRTELISIHRRRYYLSAQAALLGEEEFRPPADCGAYMQRVEIKFIEGIESKLPDTHTPLEWREIICQRLTAGEPVPELDARLDSYVTALRGADPPPLPQADVESSTTNLHPIVSSLETDNFGGFRSQQVIRSGNFVCAKLTSPDGGTISVVSIEPMPACDCTEGSNPRINTSALATLDNFLGHTRTWYYFFVAGIEPSTELAVEHLAGLYDKRRMPESCFNAIFSLISVEKLKFYYEEVAGFDETKRSFHLVQIGSLCSIMVKVSWSDPD